MAKSRLISSIVPLRVPPLVSKCWPQATQIDCYTGEVSLVSDPGGETLKAVIRNLRNFTVPGEGCY